MVSLFPTQPQVVDVTAQTYTDLDHALMERFEDMAEIKDIAEYGMSQGVSGFIYSTELAEFYDKHEEDIEDVLDGCDIRLHDLVNDQEFYTIQELKEKSVWFVVECHCQTRVNAEYDKQSDNWDS